MSVGDFCNRNVVTVARDASVRDAADLMRTLHVGDLVVVDERDGTRIPVGILTDRDVVVEIVAEEVDANTVDVGDIMSFEIVTAPEDADLLDTVKDMRKAGVRRVPVVDDGGALVGILAVDDVLEIVAQTLSDLANLPFRERKREEESRD